MDLSVLLVKDCDFDREIGVIEVANQPREFTTWGLFQAAKKYFKSVRYFGTGRSGLWIYRVLKALLGHWRARGVGLGIAAWYHAKTFDIVVGMKDCGIILGLWKRFLGRSKPFVVAIEYRLMRPEKRWQDRIRNWIIREGYKGIDCMICNSRLQVDPFQRVVDNTRVVYCPRGVDADYFDAKCSVRMPSLEFRPLVLCPGDMERNDSLLLDAIQTLDVNLCRVTRSRQVVARIHQLLSDRHRRLLRERVEILFDVPWGKLRQLYASADVVVLPIESSTQPAGLSSLLEAMAMGRPIVVTQGLCSHGYVQDGESALVVQPGSLDAMREAIHRVLVHDELAKKLGCNARRLAETQFTVEACGELFMRAVGSIMKQAAPE